MLIDAFVLSLWLNLWDNQAQMWSVSQVNGKDVTTNFKKVLKLAKSFLSLKIYGSSGVNILKTIPIPLLSAQALLGENEQGHNC